MTTILLVDDQEMIRVGLRTILESNDDLEVVGDVSDGFAALRFLADHPVDLVLMDIRMPGIDGVETTRRIRRTVPADRTRIVVLTTFEHDVTVIAALRAVADGFLGKTVGPAELARAIRQVEAGAGTLSPVAQAAVIQQVTRAPERAVDADLAAQFTVLTPRERDIVVAVARGGSNEQIAKDLFLSPFTVKTHANRAMAKLGARDRAQLVSMTYRAGLID